VVIRHALAETQPIPHDIEAYCHDISAQDKLITERLLEDDMRILGTDMSIQKLDQTRIPSAVGQDESALQYNKMHQRYRTIDLDESEQQFNNMSYPLMQSAEFGMS